MMLGDGGIYHVQILGRAEYQGKVAISVQKNGRFLDLQNLL